MRHSVVLCKCPRDQLCKGCRDALFAQLKGVAARRGEAWAEHVAERVPRDRVWPRNDARVKDIARAKVSDLARDPVLAAMLAAELAWWAERWWRTGQGPLVTSRHVRP